MAKSAYLSTVSKQIQTCDAYFKYLVSVLDDFKIDLPYIDGIDGKDTTPIIEAIQKPTNEAILHIEELKNLIEEVQHG